MPAPSSLEGDADAGAAVAKHPDVARVDFTGGPRGGAALGALAGARSVSFTSELGGHAPVLVFADADVDAAVAGACFAAFLASGQTCVSAKRILVADAIFEEFAEKFARRTGALRVGDPFEPTTDVGPVVSGAALGSARAHVINAAADGASILSGGADPCDVPERLRNGHFLRPTILGGATPAMACFQDECFAPVVTLSSFGDEAEAVRVRAGALSQRRPRDAPRRSSRRTLRPPERPRGVSRWRRDARARRCRSRTPTRTRWARASGRKTWPERTASPRPSTRASSRAVLRVGPNVAEMTTARSTTRPRTKWRHRDVWLPPRHRLGQRAPPERAGRALGRLPGVGRRPRERPRGAGRVRSPRGDTPPTNPRSATRITPPRRVAATPRLRRGYSFDEFAATPRLRRVLPRTWKFLSPQVHRAQDRRDPHRRGRRGLVRRQQRALRLDEHGEEAPRHAFLEFLTTRNIISRSRLPLEHATLQRNTPVDRGIPDIPRARRSPLRPRTRVWPKPR